MSRFSTNGPLVEDTLTGLVWAKDAQPAYTGLSWPEAFDFVDGMNDDAFGGFTDWRLPNRRELYSLIDPAQREPALPEGHPFEQVWAGKYWTSTTAALFPSNAWWVQFSGGRMFYGSKVDDCAVWPVRGESPVLYATGQRHCWGADGGQLDCAEGKQDGALRSGLAWPSVRFEEVEDGVLDHVSGLVWSASADLAHGMVDWERAVSLTKTMADTTGKGWRLPDISELESLTDCDHAQPALPVDHPFSQVGEAYWSATDSGYDPTWAFCLYMHKGAVGVGYKAKPEFLVWAVRSQ